MKKSVSIVVLSLFILPAYAGGAADTVALAEKLHEEARSMHHAWVPTGKAIEKAKAALASGDDEAAMAEAARAVKLARASVAQAKTEKENWKKRQLVK